MDFLVNHTLQHLFKKYITFNKYILSNKVKKKKIGQHKTNYLKLIALHRSPVL